MKFIVVIDEPKSVDDVMALVDALPYYPIRHAIQRGDLAGPHKVTGVPQNVWWESGPVFPVVLEDEDLLTVRAAVEDPHHDLDHQVVEMLAHKLGLIDEE
jgi:hypothetical protein